MKRTAWILAGALCAFCFFLWLIWDSGVNASGISPGGASYTGFGANLPLTDPTNVSFSWDNQGTATVAAGTRQIFLKGPLDAGDQVRGRTIAVPATPWSITIGFNCMVHQAFNSCGLYVTDGTKVFTLAESNPSNSNGASLIFATDHTYGGAAIITTQGMQQTPPITYFKVRDDGTNMIWSWGIDGVNFVQILSEARTMRLTATQVGFYVDTHNSTWPAAINLLSWLQGT
jgi:hypothetical protein